MNPLSFVAKCFPCAGCALLVALAGCGDSGTLSSPSAKQLRTLTMVYLDFAAAKGTGPANEQQLLNHLRNIPGLLLAEGGVDHNAGDPVFCSQRDGEPFVVQYGIGVSMGDPAPMIACEKKGKNGTRLVAFANGQVDCIDEVAAMELVQASN